MVKNLIYNFLFRFNLNSTNEFGPEMISDFYLSAFLQSVKEAGYTIFVAIGDALDNAHMHYDLSKH